MPHDNRPALSSCLYIDENFLGIDLDRDQLKIQLLSLLAILRDFDSRNIKVQLSVDYWDIVAGADAIPFYKVLFESDTNLNISRENLLELQRYFDRCSVERVHPVTVTASDSLRTVSYTSGVYSIAKRVLEESTIFPAILCTLPSALSGEGLYRHDERNTPCFFYNLHDQIPSLSRTVLKITMPNHVGFSDIAPHAFPNLIFHADCDLGSFDLPLPEHISTIVNHLSYLNDRFIFVATEVNWDMFQMVARARVADVEFSDEGDNTKRDARKMNSRNCTFQLQDEKLTLTCAWHTKILWNKGRIHFHGPREQEKDKIFIGKFHPHLEI